MLVVGFALSTPLRAQSAFAFGVAATVGGSWQIEGVDLGYVTTWKAGPFRYLSIGGRVGVFVDESAITGGTRGIVGGLVLQTRTSILQLADVGSETNPSPFGLDLTLEGSVYAAANNPSQFGSAWGAVSVLPGVRIGNAQSVRYGLVFGPTLFIGSSTEVRPFLALRFEIPMGRGKSGR
jgi:hypothetical protein